MRLGSGVFAFVVVVAFAPVGCSSSTTSSSSSSSGGSSSGGSSSGGSTPYCCSVNSQSYSCPDQAAYTKCGDTANPDPSGCAKVNSCSTGGSSGSSGTTSNSNCCSVNGSAWDCPGSDALLKCVKGDSSACTSRSTDCPQ